MSRDDSPYTDDAYEDEYRDEADTGYDDVDDADDSFFPYPAGSFGWPPGIFGGGVADGYDDEYDDRYTEAEYEEDDSWLDEGIIGLVLVAGVALFLFPEPATSAVGIVLLLVGSIAWLADALT